MDNAGSHPKPAEPLEYASGHRRERRAADRVAMVVIVVVLIYVVFGLVGPLFNRSPIESPRAACASNLRQIGQGIAMYANDHAGKLPDDFSTLFEAEDLSPAVFVCPETPAVPPGGPTTQALMAAMKKPGGISYIYLGKWLTSTDLNQNPDIVLASEPLSNHNGTGMNVLFGDGSVEWVQGAGAQSILTQASSAQRPVKLPQNQR